VRACQPIGGSSPVWYVCDDCQRLAGIPPAVLENQHCYLTLALSNPHHYLAGKMDSVLDPNIVSRLQSALPRRWFIHITCIVAAFGLADFQELRGTTMVMLPACYLVVKAVNYIRGGMRRFNTDTQGGARKLLLQNGQDSGMTAKTRFFNFGGITLGPNGGNTMKTMLRFWDLLSEAGPAKLGEYLKRGRHSSSAAARKAFDFVLSHVHSDLKFHDLLYLKPKESQQWLSAASSSSSRGASDTRARVKLEAVFREMVQANAILLPGSGEIVGDHYKFDHGPDPITPLHSGQRLRARVEEAPAAAAAEPVVWKIDQLRELLDDPQDLAALQWILINRKTLAAQVRAAGIPERHSRVVLNAWRNAWSPAKLKLTLSCLTTESALSLGRRRSLRPVATPPPSTDGATTRSAASSAAASVRAGYEWYAPSLLEVLRATSFVAGGNKGADRLVEQLLPEVNAAVDRVFLSIPPLYRPVSRPRPLLIEHWTGAALLRDYPPPPPDAQARRLRNRRTPTII